MTTKSTPVTAPMTTRLAIFFAMNPEEELTGGDVLDKFGSDQSSEKSIRDSLDSWVRAGYFTRTRRGRRADPDASTIYAAGPEILRLRVPA